MSETESVPQDNVRVIDGAIRARGFDPRRQSFGGLAGCLGDVTAGRVDLLVIVCGRLVKHIYIYK
jgi:hypothetical protein